MNIGVVGMGLMGGSFARMLTHRTQHTVYAYDIDPAVMQKAALLDAYHRVLTPDNASCLDLLVVALYPADFATAIAPYLPRLQNGATVVDFCGTKRRVVAAMRGLAAAYPHLAWVGGHPMAGREFSGIEHAQISLFDRASMILVPVLCDIAQLDALKKFFLSVGFGRVEITDAERHDSLIAYTSQLCHVVSNAYIKNEQALSHAGYSAGSYRDLTRVARLNPAMWTQLMMDNRDKLLAELDELLANLGRYREALVNDDADLLYRLLDEGNRRKLAIDTRTKGDQ